MINRVLNRLVTTPPTISATASSPATKFSPTFSEVLQKHTAATSSSAASSTAPSYLPLKRMLGNLEGQRQQIDGAIKQAMQGKTFSSTELLALQAQVYAYSQQMEAISRLTDKAVNGIKTTLTQQL